MQTSKTFIRMLASFCLNSALGITRFLDAEEHMSAIFAPRSMENTSMGAEERVGFLVIIPRQSGVWVFKRNLPYKSRFGIRLHPICRFCFNVASCIEESEAWSRACGYCGMRWCTATHCVLKLSKVRLHETGLPKRLTNKQTNKQTILAERVRRQPGSKD